MRKVVFKYGVIAAGILVLVMIVPFMLQDIDEMVANMRRGEIIGYTTMVLSMCLVFFALREHRERNLGGVMPFRTGLLTGLAVSAFAALLFGLATAGMYAWLGPEMMHQFMLAYVEYSVGPDPAPQALTDALEMYESQRELWANPLFQGFVMFATVFPIGLVVSLVAAAVLRPRSAR